MAKVLAIMSLHSGCLPFRRNLKTKRHVFVGPRLLQAKWKGTLWLPKKSLSVCSEHFASGKPTEDNPDPELNLGYKTPLKPKRKLPQWGQTHLQSAQNVVKVYMYQYCYFKCWAEWRAGLADCNIGDKLCSDNNQSSRRPPHIIQDHGYCFGLAEMEDPNYCTNEACLKKRKEKNNEIKKLHIEVDELAQKLRQCQKSQQKEKRHV